MSIINFAITEIDNNKYDSYLDKPPIMNHSDIDSLLISYSSVSSNLI
jgi:hypothetical protein